MRGGRRVILRDAAPRSAELPMNLGRYDGVQETGASARIGGVDGGAAGRAVGWGGPARWAEGGVVGCRDCRVEHATRVGDRAARGVLPPRLARGFRDRQQRSRLPGHVAVPGKLQRLSDLGHRRPHQASAQARLRLQGRAGGCIGVRYAALFERGGNQRSPRLRNAGCTGSGEPRPLSRRAHL